MLAYTAAYIAVLMPVIVMLLRFSQNRYRDPDEEQDVSSEEDTIQDELSDGKESVDPKYAAYFSDTDSDDSGSQRKKS